MTVKDNICATVKVKKYQLKKLLTPFFPDSVLGLNWSAPNAKLHGLIPAAPTISSPRPAAKNATWPPVGPMHLLLLRSCSLQEGGWRFPKIAVKSIKISPLAEGKQPKH